MTGPVVTTTFREQGASEVSNAFERVGESSRNMSDAVDRADTSMQDTSGGFDSMTERADTAETRFTGFYDTLGGTRDALAAFSDESLSTSDKLIALGQAGADLAGGLVGFVIPAIQSMWTKLIGSTAATWALNAAQTAWTATQKGAAAAMALLNGVMRANPIMTVVTILGILIAAFLALWTRSEGFRRFFINMWNGIKSVVGGVVDWIKRAWNGVMDFFTNLPNRIGRALGAIGGVFKSAFKGAVNIAIDAINWMIDRVNDLVYGINLINPFEDIPPIPHIRRLHTGGIVPGMPGQEVPIIAMAGERVSMSGQGGGGGVATIRVASGADSKVADLINWLVRQRLITLEV